MLYYKTRRSYFSPLFCLLLCIAIPTYGDTSYQFALSGLVSKTEFENLDDETQSYGADITAYFEEVILNNDMPYFVSPFYQRISRVSLAHIRSKTDDQSSVLGGQILTETDRKFTSVGFRLAKRDLPVFLDVEFSSLEADLEFNNGQNSGSADRDNKVFQIGFFPTDRTSIAVFYNDSDTDDSYGLSLSGLFQLGSLGDIEPFGAYERIDNDGIQLEVINNVIRNASVDSSPDKIWQAGVNYFPNVKTFFGYRFREGRNSDLDRVYTTSRFRAGYYFTDHLNVIATYSTSATDDEELYAITSTLTF